MNRQDNKHVSKMLVRERHIQQLADISIKSRTMFLLAKGDDKRKLLTIATLADELIESFDHSQDGDYDALMASVLEMVSMENGNE